MFDEGRMLAGFLSEDIKPKGEIQSKQKPDAIEKNHEETISPETNAISNFINSLKNVTVRRTGGVIENGWNVFSINSQNHKVNLRKESIKNPNLHEVKAVSWDEFAELNSGSIQRAVKNITSLGELVAIIKLIPVIEDSKIFGIRERYDELRKKNGNKLAA